MINGSMGEGGGRRSNPGGGGGLGLNHAQMSLAKSKGNIMFTSSE